MDVRPAPAFAAAQAEPSAKWRRAEADSTVSSRSGGGRSHLNAAGSEAAALAPPHAPQTGETRPRAETTRDDVPNIEQTIRRFVEVSMPDGSKAQGAMGDLYQSIGSTPKIGKVHGVWRSALQATR